MFDSLLRRSIAASAVILASIPLSAFLTPRGINASDIAAINVDRLIPQRFGEWHVVPGVRLVDQAPDSLATRIYSQSVGRAYQNAAGQVVTLLVAYGPDQSEGLQLHRPEVCYTADGYTISKVDRVGVPYHERAAPLPVTHVLAERESRSEPISYWMRVGDDIARSAFEQNMVRLKYGIRRRIPDGVLVRVSTVGTEPEGYALENRFISDLLDALPAAKRPFLIGSGV